MVPVGRRVGFDGGRWWVTALTVWDDRVSVEAAVWDDTWSDEPPDPPRMARGAPRFHWRMLLEDEVGTAYLPKGGGGGGSTGHWHRVANEFEPTIPANATALTVVLTRRAWPSLQGEPPAHPVAVARVTIDIG